MVAKMLLGVQMVPEQTENIMKFNSSNLVNLLLEFDAKEMYLRLFIFLNRIVPASYEFSLIFLKEINSVAEWSFIQTYINKTLNVSTIRNQCHQNSL